VRGVRVESFAEIAEEFHARTARIAWATVATVGADGAPRTRILHPIWEDHVGWPSKTDPAFALLRLEPTRIELTGLRHRSSGRPPLIWCP
jgi:hypothetical protein